jgi:hypothetical protein
MTPPTLSLSRGVHFATVSNIQNELNSDHGAVLITGSLLFLSVLGTHSWNDRQNRLTPISKTGLNTAFCQLGKRVPARFVGRPGQ